MATLLLDKVFFLMFFLAICNVGKHIWVIVRKIMSDGYKEKYEVTRLELLLLGLSISYLLSTIFVGIKL